MRDRIPPLDADERASVLSALSGELPGAWSVYHVTKIIDAINGARCGEPVGTVKRSDAGAIAILCRDLGARPWVGVHPDGTTLGTFTHREMSHWPVIFRPEVDQ